MGFSGRRHRVLTASERARRLHSAWLTRALYGDDAAYGDLPRIPARRVEQGGFGVILRTAFGRRWASEWWRRVLERVPL